MPRLYGSHHRDGRRSDP